MGTHVDRCVFFDRDGTLVRAFLKDDGKYRGPRTVDEIEILDGVVDGIEKLREAGFKTAIVTNQPEVRRGIVSIELAAAIGSCIHDTCNVDRTYECLHDDCDNCDCRKPKPGLLLMAARELGLVLGRCYMIGDRTKDLLAAHNAGAIGVIVNVNSGIRGVVNWILAND